MGALIAGTSGMPHTGHRQLANGGQRRRGPCRVDPVGDDRDHRCAHVGQALVRRPDATRDDLGRPAPTVDDGQHDRLELGRQAGVEGQLLVQTRLAGLPAEVGAHDHDRVRASAHRAVPLQDVRRRAGRRPPSASSPAASA